MKTLLKLFLLFSLSCTAFVAQASRLILVDESVQDAVLSQHRPRSGDHIQVIHSADVDVLKKIPALGFDSIHVLVHGSRDTLHFTSESVKMTDPRASTWFGALSRLGTLTGEADLLIYACSFAQSSDTLEKIHQWSGFDIAASDRLIGANELGGTHRLHRQLGNISSDPLLSQHQWNQASVTLQTVIATAVIAGIKASDFEMAVWWDAAAANALTDLNGTTAQSSGDAVEYVLDQSGLQFNLSKTATGETSATLNIDTDGYHGIDYNSGGYLAANINGGPATDIAGALVVLNPTQTDLDNDNTRITNHRGDSWAGMSLGKSLRGGITSSWGFGLDTAGNRNAYSGTTLSPVRQMLAGEFVDSTSYSLYHNLTALSAQRRPDNFDYDSLPLGSFVLGNNSAGGTKGSDYSGLIHEVIYYGTQLSASQRHVLSEYLLAKWGVSDSNRVYDGSADYRHDLIGLSRKSNADQILSTEWFGGIRLSHPTSSGILNEDGDSVFLGHDNGTGARVANDPSDIEYRIWHLKADRNSNQNSSLTLTISEGISADDTTYLERSSDPSSGVWTYVATAKAQTDAVDRSRVSVSYTINAQDGYYRVNIDNQSPSFAKKDFHTEGAVNGGQNAAKLSGEYGLSEAGTLYYLLVRDDNPISSLTLEQVKNAKSNLSANADWIAADSFGLSAYDANDATTQATIEVGNLLSQASYKMLYVLEDSYGNARLLYNDAEDFFQSIDLVPPAVVQPFSLIVQATQMRLQGQLSENGVVYAVGGPTPITQPTRQQIEAGQDASGNTAALRFLNDDGQMGVSVTEDANYNFAEVITGLEPNTEYRFFIYVTDTVSTRNNIQQTQPNYLADIKTAEGTTLFGHGPTPVISVRDAADPQMFGDEVYVRNSPVSMQVEFLAEIKDFDPLNLEGEEPDEDVIATQATISFPPDYLKTPRKLFFFNAQVSPDVNGVLSPTQFTVTVPEGIGIGFAEPEDNKEASITVHFDNQQPEIELTAQSSASVMRTDEDFVLDLSSSELIKGLEIADFTLYIDGQVVTANEAVVESVTAADDEHGYTSSYEVVISADGMAGSDGLLQMELRNAAIQDRAGNTSSLIGRNQAPQINVDGTRPSFDSITPAKIYSPSLVSVNFSEAVTGLTADNLVPTITAGSISIEDIRSTSGGSVWTIDLDTDLGIGRKEEITISWAQTDQIKDLAGWPLQTPAAQTIEFDSDVPVVSIEGSTGTELFEDGRTISNSETITLLVNFSKDITADDPLAKNEIDVEGAQIFSSPTFINSRRYSVELQPAIADGEISIQVTQGAVQDSDGNPAIQPNPFILDYDRVSPDAPELAEQPTDYVRAAGATFTVSFSERMKPLEGSAFQSFPDGAVFTVDPTNLQEALGGYKYRISVDASTVFGNTDSELSVQLKADASSDIYGNLAPVSNQVSWQVDNSYPSVVQLSTDNLIAQKTPIVVEFSEAVQFDASGLSATVNITGGVNNQPAIITELQMDLTDEEQQLDPPSSHSRWRFFLDSDVSGLQSGDVVLSIDAAAILDRVGNLLREDYEFTFQYDTRDFDPPTITGDVAASSTGPYARLSWLAANDLYEGKPGTEQALLVYRVYQSLQEPVLTESSGLEEDFSTLTGLIGSPSALSPDSTNPKRTVSTAKDQLGAVVYGLEFGQSYYLTVVVQDSVGNWAVYPSVVASVSEGISQEVIDNLLLDVDQNNDGDLDQLSALYGIDGDGDGFPDNLEEILIDRGLGLEYEDDYWAMTSFDGNDNGMPDVLDVVMEGVEASSGTFTPGTDLRIGSSGIISVFSAEDFSASQSVGFDLYAAVVSEESPFCKPVREGFTLPFNFRSRCPQALITGVTSGDYLLSWQAMDHQTGVWAQLNAGAAVCNDRVDDCRNSQLEVLPIVEFDSSVKEVVGLRKSTFDIELRLLGPVPEGADGRPESVMVPVRAVQSEDFSGNISPALGTLFEIEVATTANGGSGKKEIVFNESSSGELLFSLTQGGASDSPIYYSAVSDEPERALLSVPSSEFRRFTRIKVTAGASLDEAIAEGDFSPYFLLETLFTPLTTQTQFPGDILAKDDEGSWEVRVVPPGNYPPGEVTYEWDADAEIKALFQGYATFNEPIYNTSFSLTSTDGSIEGLADVPVGHYTISVLIRFGDSLEIYKDLRIQIVESRADSQQRQGDPDADGKLNESALDTDNDGIADYLDAYDISAQKLQARLSKLGVPDPTFVLEVIAQGHQDEQVKDPYLRLGAASSTSGDYVAGVSFDDLLAEYERLHQAQMADEAQDVTEEAVAEEAEDPLLESLRLDVQDIEFALHESFGIYDFQVYQMTDEPVKLIVPLGMPLEKEQIEKGLYLRQFLGIDEQSATASWRALDTSPAGLDVLVSHSDGTCSNQLEDYKRSFAQAQEGDHCMMLTIRDTSEGDSDCTQGGSCSRNGVFRSVIALATVSSSSSRNSAAESGISGCSLAVRSQQPALSAQEFQPDLLLLLLLAALIGIIVKKQKTLAQRSATSVSASHAD